MTVARSVADVLDEHVVFEVECIDRMYCNVYVPQLQHAGGLLGFVQRHLGFPVASTAPLAKITDRFALEVHRYADTQQIPWVDFAKGQRKDDVMRDRLATFTHDEGVVFIGRAQEKTKLFRTEKRRDQQGKSYPWIVPATGVMTSCFYCVDADFGPFFVKFCQSGHRGHNSSRRSPESPTVSQRIVWGITATAAGYEREPWDVHAARPVAKQCERMFGMGKLRAVHWLFAQASTGIKDLPRNGAWVLSRAVESPTSAAGSVSGSATDAARRISAAVADVLPGSPDSVEVRLKRAEAAVARAKQAEQEALDQARNADNLAEVAKAVTEEGRQRQREAAREGKQEIDRRAQEARRSLEHQVGQEREQASQEVTDRLEKLRAEVEAHTLQARQDADEAAKRAQEQIAQAHEQMTAARTLAAEATRAAQDAADQAHQQARAVAEQADLNAGSADRALADARGTEELLATETARAIQAEREYEVPERLDERTKAELLDIAHPLQISGVARMSKEQLVRSIQRASRAKARTSTATR